jgi:hypothetical protein
MTATEVKSMDTRLEGSEQESSAQGLYQSKEQSFNAPGMRGMGKSMRKNSEHIARTGAKTAIPSTCHQPYSIMPLHNISHVSCTY